MSCSSADRSSLSGFVATTASSSWVNSGPIAEPIWAISLPGRNRSSRAIREANSVAGTVVGAPSTPNARLASALPTSRIAFVSSSTNSGTPSARSTISSTIAGSIIAPPAVCRTSPAEFFGVRRLSVSEVTCVCSVQGGANSGRNVTTARTGMRRIRVIV